jgi:hypothetical protein
MQTPQAAIDYAKLQGMVERLSTAIACKPSVPRIGDDPVTLRSDYQVAVDVFKVLTDIRFRCLVFVTAVVTLAAAMLPATTNPEVRIGLAVLGFFATLGIAIYELRNSQLYEAAIHRAKVLETRLELKGSSSAFKEAGLLGERPTYIDKKHKETWNRLCPNQRRALLKTGEIALMKFWFVPVKHDHGLALIYGAVLGGWVYLVASGVLFLPAPAGWPTLEAPYIRLLSGLIGFGVGVCSFRMWIYHDKNRYQPSVH